MKQKLTLLLTALLLLTGTSLRAQRAEVVSYTLAPSIGSNNSYNGNCDIDIAGVTWNLTGNSKMIPWRIGGKSLDSVDRNLYSKTPLSDNISKIDVVHGNAEGITVNSMTLTVSANGDFSNPVSVLTGEFAANDTTTFLKPSTVGWANMYYKITYNVTVSGSNNKFLEFNNAAFYTEQGGQQQETVATPIIAPVAGTYYEPQSVSLSCATDGAVIRYTLDGSDPTESSPEYDSTFNIAETTTVKAKAWKEGYEASNIASAEYIIVSQVTILEARLLDDNQYACVRGVVNFIDGRNVHIQDSTAAIDLFLNTGTVPSALSIGDMVQAYGKKTVYKGLVELAEIDGSNPDVFTVLSSGHDLPLAIQTIADINEDFSGSNLLQSTRVKIENATIGPINPTGTTVISQDGHALNIYRIPVVEGMIEGDWVTVTGIISCYNTPQLLIADADNITFTHRPVLSANPTTVTGMSYEYEEGGPSQVAGFLLSGNHLEHNVSIYPSESFEVSTYPANQFRPENPAMIYLPHSGYFYDLNISVRLKAGLEAGSYNEQLVVVSEGADTLFVNVSGNVTHNGPTPPVSGDYVRINNIDEISEGSRVVFAARFDENAASYYAMTNTSSGKPAGVLFTSATTTDENEILPASIVDEESSYYWTVGLTANGYNFTNANGELIGYSTGTNFATGGDNTEWDIELNTSGGSAMVPNYTAFNILNTSDTTRGFALNSQFKFGPYSASTNLNNSGYNFFLDIFVKTDGNSAPIVATPTFTPASGTYYEAQTVSIACATGGAAIHYTLDGSTPTETSPVYSTPLAISENTTVKAIAMKEGHDNSAVAEATYTIQLGVVIIFNQDWEDDWNGWTEVKETGDSLWRIASYGGNHYAYANGFNHDV